MAGELQALSPAQRRIWFAEQRGGTGATYVIESSSRLTGALDVGRLGEALNALFKRHPALRTQLTVDEDGRPWLRVGAAAACLDLLEASGLTAAEREAHAWRIAETIVSRQFVLGDGPLTRCALIRVSSREHLLVFAYHHLLGDAVSSGIIRRDLLRLYASGEEPSAPCTGAGQARPSADPDVQATARRLADAPRESTFRATVPGAAARSPRAHWCQAAIDPALSRRVAAVANELRATPFIVQLTALHLLLQRYGGHDQTLAGFMTANRARADRNEVGLYAQTLVSRLGGTWNLTGADAIRLVRADVIEAVQHENAELNEVLRLLPGTGAQGTTHPLFQCMLSQIEFGPAVTAASVTATAVIVPLRYAWLDAEFRIYPDAVEGARIALRCPEERYDLETGSQLLRHYLQLLRSLTADPQAPVSSLAVMTPEEAARVLELGVGAPARKTGPVAALLAERLSAAPAHDVAVTFADEHLTFGELRRRAWRVAAALRSDGTGPGSVVAVCVPRSLDLIVAVAGVILSGAALLPVDPELPEQRRRFMVENLAPTAMLVADPGDGIGRAVTVSEAVRLGDGGGPPLPLPAATDLAYIIYTSGSTGQPKPVGNTQAGLTNRLAWMQAQYPIGPGDAVLHKTPVSFDVSVWELTWPLLAGARMVLARPGGHRDPYYLGELIRAEQVTAVHFVPSMLAAFLAAGQADGSLPLRHVFLSGEALPGPLARTLLAGCAAGVHNLYGPTEAAIDVTSFDCRDEPGGAAIPIGCPVPGSRVHVLDPGGRVQPPGATGELCLGGVQLAAGYTGHDEMTAERFAPHLAGSDERFYRTGDLGVMRRDGVITYLGRADRQVKIRGFRIEPGEVEAALEQVDGIQQAVVIASEALGRRDLVAFVRTRAAALDATAIAVQLARTLPQYAIPARIHLVDSFPTTTSGKADHAKLHHEDARLTARRDGESRQPDGDPAAALDEIPAALLRIMRQVLGADGFGIDDSFFAHGGDSIRSLEVVAHARTAGLALSVEEIFRQPTVRQLAAVTSPADVTGNAAPQPFSLLTNQEHAHLPARAEDAYPLSTALRGLVVESSRPERYRVYLTSLRVRGEPDIASLRQACAAVVARHPVLRSSLWRAAGAAGAGIQVVYADVPDRVQVRDLRGMPATGQEQEFQRWFAAERRRPFDWYAPPLFRLTVHLLSGGEFRLTLAGRFPIRCRSGSPAAEPRLRSSPPAGPGPAC
jgi:nonribosomal peptide synthetase protein BlmVI